MCDKLGIEPTTFACYHKNNINKCMAMAVTDFVFGYSIDDGSDAMKLGFVRAQQYKIDDRLDNSNIETNVDGKRKVVSEKDDPWLVNCAVTLISLGTPYNPKFPLK